MLHLQNIPEEVYNTNALADFVKDNAFENYYCELKNLYNGRKPKNCSETCSETYLCFLKLQPFLYFLFSLSMYSLSIIE